MRAARCQGGAAAVLREYARALVARSSEGDSERVAVLLAEAERLSEDLGIASGTPAPARPREAGFAREGDFWTIGDDGQTIRLRDVKGLRYIAFLLAAPGSEVHVLELVAAVDGAFRGRTRSPATASTRRARRGPMHVLTV